MERLRRFGIPYVPSPVDRHKFYKDLEDTDILPPYPDGIQLIRNINREYRVAGEEFMKAQKRLVEFTTKGVVPEDLKTNAPPIQPLSMWVLNRTP